MPTLSFSFTITLHHLAPGATAAGLNYPDTTVPSVDVPQLRQLLHALRKTAATVTIYEPALPEIRIQTDREIFVVRTRNRRLYFVGYETALRGQEHSVSYILTTITGLAEQSRSMPPIPGAGSADPLRAASASPLPTARPGAPEQAGRRPRWIKIAVLAVVIAGCNGVTAWMLLRPVRTLAPKYTLLPAAESEALLAKYAGEYRTGGKEGDRRLLLSSSGALQLAKFGPNLAITQLVPKTARGALVEGRPALITNDPAALTLKDADTVVFFGNTYRRH